MTTGAATRAARVARRPQQEFGQGVARMLQEQPGWVKRPLEQPQATQKWAWVAVEPQEKSQAAAEPLETSWVVVQTPEVKVSGVVKLPLQVAEQSQPRMGGLAQPPQDVPAWRAPPNLLASRMSVGWQPPLPPSRWLHLFPGRPPPPPLIQPGAGKPALHPF